MTEQNRFKSWALWASVLGALWLILKATGIAEELGIEETTFTACVDAVGVLLTAFGIVNNPTNKEGL